MGHHWVRWGDRNQEQSLARFHPIYFASLGRLPALTSHCTESFPLRPAFSDWLPYRQSCQAFRPCFPLLGWHSKQTSYLWKAQELQDLKFLPCRVVFHLLPLDSRNRDPVVVSTLSDSSRVCWAIEVYRSSMGQQPQNLILHDWSPVTWPHSYWS